MEYNALKDSVIYQCDIGRKYTIPKFGQSLENFERLKNEYLIRDYSVMEDVIEITV